MSDADFFPVILANQVLGGDFNSYLNMNLREAHG
jgi:predicted Zn-dependent peptidase